MTKKIMIHDLHNLKPLTKEQLKKIQLFNENDKMEIIKVLNDMIYYLVDSLEDKN